MHTPPHTPSFQELRARIRALRDGNLDDAVAIDRTVTVENGTTTVELTSAEAPGGKKIFRSKNKIVAFWELRQMHGVDVLASDARVIPENDRRRQSREERWKRQRKRCTNPYCDRGHVQVMDDLFACPTCKGKGWVV